MGRPASIENDELLARISRVFRDVGYEGASLALLSSATGLKRPSLYHRFPNGKEQMATEVLDSAALWLEKNVLAVLHSDALPQDRVAVMVLRLSEFYEDGERACLLNMLSAPLGMSGAFASRVKRTFEEWIDGLAATVQAAGHPATIARERAVRAIALIQGALVLSRGLGSTKPFRDALAIVQKDLLARSP